MWIFKVTTKNVFKKMTYSKHVGFNKINFSWRDAWVACIDKAISELSDYEVIVKIESVNEIVTGKSNIVDEIINDTVNDFLRCDNE